jgi:hypothetical protein
LYNKIPVEVKPSQPAAKETFVGAFDEEINNPGDDNKSPFILRKDYKISLNK